MKTKILRIIVLTAVILMSACKKDKTTGNNNDNGTCIDIDGNVYKTVKIGTQVWMAENLKTTRYNDGSAIPTGISNKDWPFTSTGAYGIYNNDPANDAIYGKLYNWYAVHTGKLAPAGWHVATQAEWKTLIDYLGGFKVAGAAMKDTTSWRYLTPNTNNSSGFTCLPAGYRAAARNYGVEDGGYFGITADAGFWSSTEYNVYDGVECGVMWDIMDNASYEVTDHKESGYAVRCVKN